MTPQNQDFRSPRTGLLCVLAAALVTIFNWVVPVLWVQPEKPHHIDEVFLPQEALAQWEGVTPRELGWPASTARLALEAAYAGLFAWDEGSKILADQRAGRLSADGLLRRVGNWTTKRIDDPDRLYISGRCVIGAFGLCAVVALFYAGLQWGGVEVAWLVGMLAAFCPLFVQHSQYLLADVPGIAAAALVLALSARDKDESGWTTAWLGIACGLAAASKHHFGIWFLPAAWWAMCGPHMTGQSCSVRFRRLVLVTLAAALTYLLFVPQWLQNPVLMVKEFLHVVASKLETQASQSPVQRGLANLNTAFVPSGVVVLAGLVAALATGWRYLGWRHAGMLLMSAGYLLLILKAGQMSGRYGLPLLPLLLLAAGWGWTKVWQLSQGRWRVLVSGLLAALSFVTGLQLWQSQRVTGEPPRDHLAAAWIREHVASGSRILVHELFIGGLPRSVPDLDEEIAFYRSPQAYGRKMESNGVDWETAETPMRSAVLNDEAFLLFWLEKERLIRQPDQGYDLVFYANGRSLNALKREVAIDRFLTPSDDPPLLAYALLTYSLDAPHEPIAVFGNPDRQRLYLYKRPARAVGE